MKMKRAAGVRSEEQGESSSKVPFLIQLVARIVVFLTFALPLAAASDEASLHPRWIDEPGAGAVGFAATHVKGRYPQEELAIARARERLAAELGVEVSSVQTIEERVVGERSYLLSEQLIQLDVKNRTVRAHVRAMWRDPKSDEVWVWLYPLAGN